MCWCQLLHAIELVDTVFCMSPWVHSCQETDHDLHLGFERMILLTTGMENIRDVIPFPRWPENARG